MTKSGNLLDSEADGNSVHYADSTLPTPSEDMSRSTLALIDSNYNYQTKDSLHLANGTILNPHVNEGFILNGTPSLQDLPTNEVESPEEQLLTSRRGFQTLVGDEPTLVKIRTTKSVPAIITEGPTPVPTDNVEEIDDKGGDTALTKHSSMGFFDHLRKNHSTQSSPNSSFRPLSLNVVNQAARRLLEFPSGFGKKFLPPLWGSNKSLASPGPSPGYLNPYYEAESPDELALVYASAAYGVRLIKRHVNYCTVEMPGKLLQSST